MVQARYDIGAAGQPWGAAEKAQWLARQHKQRSYVQDVEARIQALADRFDVFQYGELDYPQGRYATYGVRSRDWRTDKPSALVTGGVHGYETSGVMGALQFLETEAERYLPHCNVLVTPCISPWGYETINRWNPEAVDPNRSFYVDSPARESANLMACVQAQSDQWLLHVDLHETTDTDASEFRPALAARDGQDIDLWEHIPDGYYLVGDTENPQPEFQAAVIRAVEQVTHIAPPDEGGCIIGEPLEQHGVINYAVAKLGLCLSISQARFSTTTEVYPDSARVDEANCNLAQVVTITSALDYALAASA